MIDALKPGGAEQLMPTLLSHFNKETFEMRVCVLKVKTGNPISKELTNLGIPVDLIHANSLKNPFNLFRILSYLNKYQPDLIHTQLQYSDILGSIAAKIKRRPSTSTLHTLDAIDEHGSSLWRKKIRWVVLQRFCDQIITVSDKTREHHINVGKIPDGKTKTIYNGIHLSRFQDRNSSKLAEKKHELNLPSHHKIITTIAVLRELKGIQYMINALPMILRQYPNTTYLIIGEGAYANTLGGLIIDQRLEDHVVMAGHRTDIPDMLAISDMFVLPSLRDALPTVLIEALAAGVPVVTTNVGGIPEIIEHGKNGVLVNPADPQQLADACIQLLSNEDKRRELSTAGFETAKEKFDVRTQVEHLKGIYINLIEQYKYTKDEPPAKYNSR